MEKKKLKKLELKKPNNISLLSDEHMHQVKGSGYWDPEMGYVADEVTVYGGNILEYANLQYSGGNELHYAFETLVNAGAIIYNGGVWVWNRTGAQW